MASHRDAASIIGTSATPQSLILCSNAFHIQCLCFFSAEKEMGVEMDLLLMPT